MFNCSVTINVQEYFDHSLKKSRRNSSKALGHFSQKSRRNSSKALGQFLEKISPNISKALHFSGIFGHEMVSDLIRRELDWIGMAFYGQHEVIY